MRFRPIILPAFFCLVAAMSACVKTPETAALQESPFGPGGIPPQLRSKNSNEAGIPVKPGGNLPATAANFTREEDMVFTDPDNPDAGIPEISAILQNAKKRSAWELSETIAKQRAAREGKPLLIWFTDSMRSPMCKVLSQELFSTPDFEKWANEKVIRLRVDASPSLDDPNLSLDETQTRLIAIRQYVAQLKKRYKVLGHPTVLALNPAGEVIGRYRGYKRGNAEFFWGQLKHSESVATNTHGEWKKSLEKKGYRDWTDRNSRKVFAKLLEYRNGTLDLVEPDGTRCQTHEDKLCDEDRQWIADQKKSRQAVSP